MKITRAWGAREADSRHVLEPARALGAAAVAKQAWLDTHSKRVRACHWGTLPTVFENLVSNTATTERRLSVLLRESVCAVVLRM